MNKYHIRFNTKHGDSDLVWRIFENDVEHLVKDFRINVPMFGEATTEHGVLKWNVSCHGFMNIKDDIAFIDSFMNPTWYKLDNPIQHPNYEVHYICEALVTK